VAGNKDWRTQLDRSGRLAGAPRCTLVAYWGQLRNAEKTIAAEADYCLSRNQGGALCVSHVDMLGGSVFWGVGGK